MKMCKKTATWQPFYPFKMNALKCFNYIINIQKIYKNMQIKNKANEMWREKKHIFACAYHVYVAFFTKIISDSYLHSVVSLHEPSTEVRTG